MNINQEDPKSSITMEMTLKVLLPISTFAFLTGTFPTDTSLLNYFEQSTGFGNGRCKQNAVDKDGFRNVFYSSYCPSHFGVWPPARDVHGPPLQNSSAFLLWMPAPYFDLTEFSGVLAGYGSAAMIACCCYGRNLLPNEYYLLYYFCVGVCLVRRAIPSDSGRCTRADITHRPIAAVVTRGGIFRSSWVCLLGLGSSSAVPARQARCGASRSRRPHGRYVLASTGTRLARLCWCLSRTRRLLFWYSGLHWNIQSSKVPRQRSRHFLVQARRWGMTSGLIPCSTDMGLHTVQRSALR